MGSYISNTPEEQREMLSTVGAPDVESLFSHIPQEVRAGELDLPAGLSELEVRRKVTGMAAKNRVYPTVLRGAGAYRHYIPAVVKRLASREEFVTAYTPYQAEISQGLLQSIFEYQTMICALTGMDAANASVYGGGTAAAEGVAMCRERKRTRAFVSACADPQVIQTIRTYCFGAGTQVELIPEREGRTDLEALKGLLDQESACVYLQQPNYYGNMEDAAAAGEIAHAAGAKFIMGVNPIACAMMESPAACGADVAVGEGQPLGLELSWGGPYLGFMATTKAMTRKLPGRIVGQAHDGQGRRGYVLTLTAREQHIRREKASSNICSNEALCAFTVGAYLSAMGPQGLAQVATQCMSKAHYFAGELEKIGLKRVHTGEFFHEFVTTCPRRDEVLQALDGAGILGGLPVEGGLLWCVTEVVSREELDRAVSIIKEVCGA